MPSITIDKRFRGPPNSGNGGYVCGLLAGHIDGRSAEIALRAPPPLARPLIIVPSAYGERWTCAMEIEFSPQAGSHKLKFRKFQLQATPKQKRLLVVLHSMRAITNCQRVSCADRRVLREMGCVSLRDP